MSAENTTPESAANVIEDATSAVADAQQPTLGDPGNEPITPEPTTLEGAVELLLKILGIPAREIDAINITHNGQVRTNTIDRVFRTAKFKPLPRFKRDRDGFLIRNEDAE